MGSWTESVTGGTVSEDLPWSRMLPPLLVVPTAANNMYAEAPDAEVAERETASFSLLVSIDEGGLVVVSANGTFTLQASQLFERLQGPSLDYPSAVTWPES